jgi:hypothetical protein
MLTPTRLHVGSLRERMSSKATFFSVAPNTLGWRRRQRRQQHAIAHEQKSIGTHTHPEATGLLASECLAAGAHQVFAAPQTAGERSIG